MAKPSLALQTGCIRHVIALAAKSCPPEVRDGAEHALRTLEWLTANAEVVKEAARLRRENPALAELLVAFPGARITDVRDQKD